MRPVFLPVFLLVLCGPIAHAEVIDLEGTVKAVDVDARTVTVERKTPSGSKTLTLEVAKKAGDVADIKPGSPISFSYDPNLEIVTSVKRTDRKQPSVPAAHALMASLGKQLQGVSRYNARSGEFTVSYDFRDQKQLEDFIPGPESVARIRDRTLTLDRGSLLQHKIHWDVACVSGVMIRSGDTFGRLYFSNHPACTAYGGGSIRTPPPTSVQDLDRNGQLLAVKQGKAKQWWTDVGGLQQNTRSPFKLCMQGKQITWESNGRKGALPYTAAALGGLCIETAEPGLVLSTLEITGRVDTEWLQEHERK
jgi:hypothetical protein